MEALIRSAASSILDHAFANEETRAKADHSALKAQAAKDLKSSGARPSDIDLPLNLRSAASKRDLNEKVTDLANEIYRCMAKSTISDNQQHDPAYCVLVSLKTVCPDLWTVLTKSRIRGGSATGVTLPKLTIANAFVGIDVAKVVKFETIVCNRSGGPLQRLASDLKKRQQQQQQRRPLAALDGNSMQKRTPSGASRTPSDIGSPKWGNSPTSPSFPPPALTSPVAQLAAQAVPSTPPLSPADAASARTPIAQIADGSTTGSSEKKDQQQDVAAAIASSPQEEQKRNRVKESRDFMQSLVLPPAEVPHPDAPKLLMDRFHLDTLAKPYVTCSSTATPVTPSPRAHRHRERRSGKKRARSVASDDEDTASTGSSSSSDGSSTSAEPAQCKYCGSSKYVPHHMHEINDLGCQLRAPAPSAIGPGIRRNQRSIDAIVPSAHDYYFGYAGECALASMLTPFANLPLGRDSFKDDQSHSDAPPNRASTFSCASVLRRDTTEEIKRFVQSVTGEQEREAIMLPPRNKSDRIVPSDCLLQCPRCEEFYHPQCSRVPQREVRKPGKCVECRLDRLQKRQAHRARRRTEGNDDEDADDRSFRYFSCSVS